MAWEWKDALSSHWSELLHRQQWEKLRKGWTHVLFTPDSLVRPTVPGIYNVCQMNKSTHFRGGRALGCIVASNTVSWMNGWRATEACPGLPGIGLQEPQLAPYFLKSTLLRGGRWLANLLSGSHEGEVLHQRPTRNGFASVTLDPAHGHACCVSNTAFLSLYVLQPLSWSLEKSFWIVASASVHGEPGGLTAPEMLRGHWQPRTHDTFSLSVILALG